MHFDVSRPATSQGRPLPPPPPPVPEEEVEEAGPPLSTPPQPKASPATRPAVKRKEAPNHWMVTIGKYLLPLWMVSRKITSATPPAIAERSSARTMYQCLLDPAGAQKNLR